MRESSSGSAGSGGSSAPPTGLSRLSVAPNLLDQDFAAAGPNQKWGNNMSYVSTREGWLYLAIIIDPLHPLRVVGFSNRRIDFTEELAFSALRRPRFCDSSDHRPLHSPRAPRRPAMLPRLPDSSLRKYGVLNLDVGKGKLLR